MRAFSLRELLIVSVLSLGTFVGIINIYVLSIVITLVADDLGVSEAGIGQLSTVHALVAGAVGLMAAPLMDRFPRRTLLRASSGILLVSTAATALVPGYGALVATRALAGVGAGFLMSNCYAGAADAFPDSAKRNRVIGILLSATGISAVIGAPILTQIAALGGWRWSTAFLLIPLLVTFAGVGLIPRRERVQAGGSFLSDYLSGYRRVLRNAETTWLLATSVIRNTVWAGTLAYAGAIWVAIFGVSVAGYGWIVMLFGGSYFVTSNITPRVIERSSPRLVYVVGGAVLCAAALLFPLTYGYLAAGVASMIVLGAAGGLMGVSSVVLLQDSLPAARGAVMSLSSTTGELGAAAGAAIGGAVLVVWGHGAIVPVLGLLVPLAVVCLWMSSRAVVIEAEEQAVVAP